MKRIIGLIVYLNTTGVFADVNDAISKQIDGQIARSTSNSISRNIDYHQLNSEPVRQGSSVPNSINIYRQDREFSDSNEALPSSYLPTNSYPNTNRFSR